jgi:TP901 family phage tail tape measure protein
LAIDKTVAVRLRLINAEFIAATKAAGKSVADLGRDIDKAAKGGKLEKISQGALIAGAGFLTMAGMTVKAFMQFDKQMSAVAAAGDEYAASLDGLRASALQAGKDTKFSATEAAAGQEALAKAGVSAADIMGGALTGALNLAASGNLSVADSAEVAASAMVTFGLTGSQVEHVADVLAAAAGKAQGDVSDLALGFKQSSAVAAQLGLSLEETAGALAMFANAGITGSDAGTSFKQMMLMMVDPTIRARGVMDDLGISFFNADGSMKSFAQISEVLKTQLGDLSQEQQGAALKTIFGADAYRVAAIAMREGSAGADEWIGKVNDSGYAAEQAAKKLDNLSGDLEMLTGSLETAFISTGSGADGPLRNLTQGVTGLVDAYLGLPGPVQQGVFWVTTATGVALAAAGAYGTMAPKVQKARAELTSLGPAGAKANAAMGALGKTAGVVGAALMAFQVIGSFHEGFELTAQGADRLRDSLLKLYATGETAGKLAELTGGNLQSLAKDFQVLDRSGIYGATNSWNRFAESLAGGGEVTDARLKIDALDTALAQLVANGNASAAASAFQQFQEIAAMRGVTPEELARGFNDYTDAVAAAGEAAGGATGPTGDLAGKTGELAGSMGEAAGQAKKLTDSWNELHGATLATDEAMLAARVAVDSLKESFRENGAAIRGNSTAALRNRIALQEAIAAAVAARQAKLEEGASVDEATAAYNGHIGALRRTMRAAGLTKGQIDVLIDTYGHVPESVSTSIRTPGLAPSLSGANALEHKVNSLDGRRATIYIEQIINTKITGASSATAAERRFAQADGGVVEYFASGGESHVAQIAPAGSWRVWAEPETGGEGYIPLAESKRSRSKAVVEDIVGRFGGSVAWANGGMAAPVAVSSSAGRMVAQLAPQDRQLIAALADRVVRVETVLQVDAREIARANTTGQRKLAWKG